MNSKSNSAELSDALHDHNELCYSMKKQIIFQFIKFITANEIMVSLNN